MKKVLFLLFLPIFCFSQTNHYLDSTISYQADTMNNVLSLYQKTHYSYDADNNVMFFISSIICAEIFFDDLEIHNLNLSLEATFFTLLLTLNLFLMVVLSFIIFSFLLF